MKYRELRASIEEAKKSKFSPADLKKAEKIINDPKTKGGNYSQALKNLEKFKKGISKDPQVADLLYKAHNEEVAEGKLTEAEYESLCAAMKLNPKQAEIMAGWIKSGKINAKYHGAMAGETKNTRSYAGLKSFGETIIFEADVKKDGPKMAKAVEKLAKSVGKKDMDYKDYIAMAKLLKTDWTKARKYFQPLDTYTREQLAMALKGAGFKTAAEDIFQISFR